MDNINDHILFLNSQIVYHETQIGWTIDDPQKKNRHIVILEKFRMLKDFLLNQYNTEPTKSTVSSNSNKNTNVMGIPNASLRKTPDMEKKSINSEFNKVSRITKFTSSESGKRKKEYPFSNEYISLQPTTKQLDYKLLNVISISNDSVNYDDIASELYTNYGLTLSRNELSRSLNRLIKDEKIERINKGNYRIN